MRSVDIHVQGIVQGVGFRPFVFRTAQRNLVSGWVLNASDGVHIHAEGDTSLVESFVHDVEWNAPTAAVIDSIDVADVPFRGCSGFEIRESVSASTDGRREKHLHDDAASNGEQASGLTGGFEGSVSSGELTGLAESADVTGTECSAGAADLHGLAVSARTDISPDLATCPDCLHELFDSSNRRFHYPFINCTNCGPRFTIIHELPYDRPATSMRSFTMCPTCAAEYTDPADRRFHAQPDACFACGPQLSLSIVGQDGVATTEWSGELNELDDIDRMRRRSDELLQHVADLLLQDKIVAVKGLGGYHLACLATSQHAVTRLRQRKHRPGKPLAVMMSDVSMVRLFCEVNATEQQLLESRAAPIVLLRRRQGSGEAYLGGAAATTDASAALGEAVGASDAAGISNEPASTTSVVDATDTAPLPCNLAPSVAGELHEVGVMLPSTPVQHLLMRLVGQPLVMTSANFSEEPIIAENAEAHRRLAPIADAFLDNNRDIVSRYDDSVLRVVVLSDGQPYIQMVRRARGYAPRPVPFPRFENAGQTPPHGALQAACADDASDDQATVLGVGPQMKSTFTLAHGSKAYVSQHIGDLANAQAFESWRTTLQLYQRMFDLQPRIIAYDLHPAYLSTQWAQQAAQDVGHTVAVQHHHAHIAAVIGENIAAGELSDLHEHVIGVALDGTGAGDDGTVWGGELLVCDCAGYQRLGHLGTMPLVGGEQSIRHPWRLAAGLLLSAGLSQHPAAQRFLSDVDGEELDVLQQMLERDINCVQTSSAGRLLDAMSALLGICRDATFDGEAPMLLEALAHRAPEAPSRLRGSGAQAGSESGFAIGLEPKPDARSGLGFEAEFAFEYDQGSATEPGPRPASCAASESEPEPCSPSIQQRYTMPLIDDATSSEAAATSSPFIIDTASLVRDVLDDMFENVPAATIAWRIHRALADAVVRSCQRIRRDTGLSTVALSGGVFANRLLLEQTFDGLQHAGFRVLLPRQLPPNDGCISYGQAVVASQRAHE